MPDTQAPNFSDLVRRLKYPILLAVGIIVVGTVGYYLLWLGEGGTWLDAAYMTFITITTVGYNEIHPLNGAGRIFTVLVAMTGIASFVLPLYGGDGTPRGGATEWSGRKAQDERESRATR